MNKISKKIVALATMAAFVLTLVPFAAFASGAADATTSYFKVADGNVEVDVNDVVKTVFEINGKDNTAADSALNGVRVWVTEEGSDAPSTAAEFYTDAECTTPLTKSGMTGVYKQQGQAVANDQNFYVKFVRNGVYTIHAAVFSADPATQQDLNNGTPLKLDAEASVITVDTAVAANTITFTKNQGGDTGNLPVNEEDKIVTLDLSGVSFEINGTDTMNLKGVVKDANGKVINGATVNFESDRNAIVLVKDSAKTNNSGEFDLSFKMTDAVDGNIYVTCGDVSYTIKVLAAESNAQNIATTLEDGYVLAGNDSHWSADYATFSDAVQFEITDKKGNALATDLSASEPAFGIGNVAGYQHENFVSIDSKPTKSTLSANDLIVVWDATNSVYTLKYKSGDAAKDLVPGEYTVTVALLSGDNATATFNVAKFGTIQDLDVTMYAKKTGAAQGQYKAITDEIALGDDLKVEAKYVDENGLKVNADANRIEYGVDGKAVEKRWDGYINQYKMADNTVANESLIGTTVYVKAYDSKAKKYVEKELTVVDAYNTYTLAFDPTEGDANKDNTVTVSVVDADGDLANKVNGEVYAYVADQSNADAKVSVSTQDAKDGKGKLTIFSDKETTVDIVVAVRNGDALYGKTLEYTVGEEDALANTSVVMTIGSPDFVVNNQVITMEDAAPYVAKDRTFVPFRALGEAIGADVVWDNDARTVTYTLGKTEVVMTIGETTYTVNGEEKTMDVAPEITGERTYVPVRFVGEALGFKVTALYAADGTTASVVFQK